MGGFPAARLFSSNFMPKPRLSAFPKCYLDQIAGDRSMSVFEWIDLARTLPADGLEMYEGFFLDFSDAEIDLVVKATQNAGFQIPMFCCSPDFTHPDPAFRVRQQKGMIRRIEATYRMGGPGTVCRVLSGQRRPTVDLADGIRWVVESIQAILPRARELGIVLGMENHYKDGFWEYPEFAQRLDVYYRIIDAIEEREFFGVQYDPSNAIVAGEDPLELLDRVAERVVSMHASDRYLEPGHSLEELRQADGSLGYSPLLKHGVTGKGLNDYDAIFRKLAAVNYRGWISIEDGMNGIDEMRESLEFLRRKVREHFPEP
jgi:sugar phosphate isomerase/epimerase